MSGTKCARGGKREGAGGVGGEGKLSRITRKSQEAARIDAKEGGFLLPHEILMRAANGQPFKQRRLKIVYHGRGPNKGQEKRREWVEEDYYPTAQEQIDAAKAAAPYYAPKLAVKALETGDAGKELVDAFRQAAINRKKPGTLEVGH